MTSLTIKTLYTINTGTEISLLLFWKSCLNQKLLVIDHVLSPCTLVKLHCASMDSPPKLSKEGTLLRPIVSSINSPPPAPQPHFNSSRFKTFNWTETMVSSDATSLFACSPTTEAAPPPVQVRAFVLNKFSDVNSEIITTTTNVLSLTIIYVFYSSRIDLQCSWSGGSFFPSSF